LRPSNAICEPQGERQEVSIGGYGKNTILTTLRVHRTGDQVSFDIATEPASWDGNTVAKRRPRLRDASLVIAAQRSVAVIDDELDGSKQWASKDGSRLRTPDPDVYVEQGCASSEAP